jgi:predicted Zn-dependent protease
MKRIINLLACLLLIMAVTSCSSVAFTGRNRMLLYSDSEITSLSNDSYNEMMATAKLSDNKAQAAVIQEVGERISSALGKYLASKGQQSVLDGITWSFKLVQDDQVNAFCMPGGQVVFYEGIMPLLDTPDLVAVVMGHEIAHAIARHGNERMSKQALSSIVGAVTGDVVEQKTSQNGRILFEAAFAVGSEYGYLLPYSRKHESEADEIGLYIMAIAGYDIEQAPVLWKRMSENESQYVPEFMSTHPSNDNRIKNLQKHMDKARKIASEVQ